MGDLIGEVVQSELYYVARSEFDRIARANAPKPALMSLYADMTRLNALYMIANAGSGHIGSSFSAADIMTHLYVSEMDRDGDVFFSSKGHDAPALYSVLISRGVLEEDLLHKLRRLNGLPGHPDISVPGLVTNTGSLGMGISKAKGMIEAARAKGAPKRVYVMTGDGELQEGQIWESLVSAANRKMGELTVIVDHNKIQSDYSVVRTSDLGALQAKFEAFGWVCERLDGHDQDALTACFARLRKEERRPKVIIADTIKGKGVSFMEGVAIDSDVEMFKFHSGAPTADHYQRAVEEIEQRLAAKLAALHVEPVRVSVAPRPHAPPAVAGQVKLFPAYTEALLKLAARAKPELIALDADLILDMGLIPFRDAYPDRFIECGIAEQDMVEVRPAAWRSMACCRSCTFSCFLSTPERANLQQRQRRRIVYVGGLSGVIPAGPGHSHQSVREISALGGIRAWRAMRIEPCCAEEVGPLLEWCAETHDGPSFLRWRQCRTQRQPGCRRTTRQPRAKATPCATAMMAADRYGRFAGRRRSAGCGGGLEEAGQVIRRDLAAVAQCH
ncbi:MAG: 1-deoxy-D-xylulose-5-phosphate synthase N-terminal domain-containing protein [Hyphomonadaceae bacterium]